MPLINLQTNLKSLKYGQDRQGGGDSGLPYIRKDISTANPGIKFDDGLVRGGTINAAVAGVTDTLRINKFLKDIPKGPLFITKQVGLQLSNPRLEVKNSPLISSIAGLLQPTRIYNLGLNTLAQVPVNAFGTHFNRHGLLPVQDNNTKYLAVVRNNAGLVNNSVDTAKSFNRLLRLTDKFKLGNNTTINTENIVNRYVGGPESVYGIGFTTINRSTFTGYSNNIKVALETSKDYAGYTREQAGRRISYFSDLGTGPNSIDNYDFDFGNTSLVAGVDQNVVTYSPPTSANPSLKTYAKLKKQIEIETNITQSTGAGLATTGSFITVDLTKYGLNRGDTNFNYISGSRLTIFDRNDDRDVYPKITFYIIKPFGGATLVDLSAYINGFRDSFNGTWNDVNYAGRAESLYIYSKFKREVSFNLQIPCFKKEELKLNHKKLNELASVTAGQYNNNLLLGGVLIQLTVPNYIVREYATLTSLSYNMPDGATWDIDEKLSMYIDAQFSFNIIHKELPQLGSKLIAPNV